MPHAPVASLLFAMLLLAPGAQADTWRVGPAQPLTRIADAARVAQDGDTVEIEPGIYRHDVAIWRQDNLTIRGLGGGAVLEADGASAEDKAIWVIRGGTITIENIEFRGARVPDLKHGDLEMLRRDRRVSEHISIAGIVADTADHGQPARIRPTSPQSLKCHPSGLIHQGRSGDATFRNRDTVHFPNLGGCIKWQRQRMIRHDDVQPMFGRKPERTDCRKNMNSVHGLQRDNRPPTGFSR